MFAAQLSVAEILQFDRGSHPIAILSKTYCPTAGVCGICAICHEEFTDYNDIVPDHKNPKGMGGSWRDDHPDNIQATHWWCNEEKGSTRMHD